LKLDEFIGFLEFSFKIHQAQLSRQIYLTNNSKNVLSIIWYLFLIKLILEQLTKLAIVSVNQLSILKQENSIVFWQIKVLLANIKIVRNCVLDMRTGRNLDFQEVTLFGKFLQTVCI
jgi:hypothetical protein